MTGSNEANDQSGNELELGEPSAAQGNDSSKRNSQRMEDQDIPSVAPETELPNQKPSQIGSSDQVAFDINAPNGDVKVAGRDFTTKQLTIENIICPEMDRRLIPVFDELRPNDFQKFIGSSIDKSLLESSICTLKQRRFIVVRGSIYEASSGFAIYACSQLNLTSAPQEMKTTVGAESSILREILDLEQKSTNLHQNPHATPISSGGFLRLEDVFLRCPADRVNCFDVSKVNPEYRATAVDEILTIIEGERSSSPLTALQEQNKYLVLFVDYASDRRGRLSGNSCTLEFTPEIEDKLIYHFATTKMPIDDGFKKLFSKQILDADKRYIWGKNPNERYESIKSQSADRFGAEIDSKDDKLENRTKTALENQLKEQLGLLNQTLEQNKIGNGNTQNRKIITREICKYILLFLCKFEELTLLQLDQLMSEFLSDDYIVLQERFISSELVVSNIDNQSQELYALDDRKNSNDIKIEYQYKDIKYHIYSEYINYADELFDNLSISVENHKIEFTSPLARKTAEQLLGKYFPRFISNVLFNTSIQKLIIFKLDEELAQTLAYEYADFLSAQKPEISLHYLTEMLNHLWRSDQSTNSNAFNKLFAERVSLILLKLLEESHSKPLVNAVLNSILENNIPDEKATTFLYLIGRLNFSSNFDTYRWVKRFIFEVGRPTSAHCKVTIALLADPYSNWNSHTSHSILCEVSSWLPEQLDNVHGMDGRATLLEIPLYIFSFQLNKLKSKQREDIGSLIPFFDFGTKNELYQDIESVLKILLAAPTGQWLHNELPVLEKIVSRNWDLTAPVFSDNENRYEEDDLIILGLFPHLSLLQNGIVEERACGEKTSILRVSCIFIELITAYALCKSYTNFQETPAIWHLLEKLSFQLSQKRLYNLYKQIFEIQNVLKKHTGNSSLRYQTAKYIANTLYTHHKNEHRKRR